MGSFHTIAYFMKIFNLSASIFEHKVFIWAENSGNIPDSEGLELVICKREGKMISEWLYNDVILIQEILN